MRGFIERGCALRDLRVYCTISSLKIEIFVFSGNIYEERLEIGYFFGILLVNCGNLLGCERMCWR